MRPPSGSPFACCRSVPSMGRPSPCIRSARQSSRLVPTKARRVGHCAASVCRTCLTATTARTSTARSSLHTVRGRAPRRVSQRNAVLYARRIVCHVVMVRMVPRAGRIVRCSPASSVTVGALVARQDARCIFHVLAARRVSAVERGGCVLPVGRCLLHVVVVSVAYHHCTGRASVVEEAVFELLLRWVLDRALMAAPDGERNNRRCTIAHNK